MKPVAFPYAASLGDINLVKGLIESGGNVDARDSDGSTTLHLAIGSGKSSSVVTQIVELLLEAGASLEAQNERGYTPLHVASANGHFESVEQLIRAGACVDAEIDSNGFTSLFLAIKADMPDHDRTQIIRLLVEAGASLEKQDSHGFHPLRKAVALGKVNAVKQLILCGADVNAVNESGKSILHVATRSPRNDEEMARIVQILLEAGASPNVSDCRELTPLHDATFLGKTKIVDRLIKAGADAEAIANVTDIKHFFHFLLPPNDKNYLKFVTFSIDYEELYHCYNSRGHTALQTAICLGIIETAKYLILAGANVNTPLAETGESCLHLVTRWVGKYGDCLAIIRLLLAAGAAINARDRNRRTPLHNAARVGNFQIFKQLIEAGADMHAIDSYDYSILLNVILSSAEYKDRTEMVRILLSAGVSTSAPDKWRYSPLNHAARLGYIGIIEQLISAGAVAEVKRFGPMDLNYAVLNTNKEQVDNYSKTLRILLDCGGILWGCDEQKRTSLHIAASKGHVEWVEAFVEAGAVVDAIDDFGQTSLHLAIALEKADERSKIIRTLLQAGASVVRRDYKNLTPLHYAVTSGKLGTTELKQLAEAYANENSDDSGILNELESINTAEDSNEDHLEVARLLLKTQVLSDKQFTPLHYAVYADKVALVEHVIRDGVDVNATTDEGVTSLNLALRSINNNGHQIVQLLLAFGASPNIVDKDGKTPLMYAISLGHDEMVQQLMTAGADVGITDVKGLSNLHYAVLENTVHNCDKIIHSLIDAGAPINITEKTKNQTPLHYAVIAGNVEAVEQLIRAGADVTAVTNENMSSLHLALRSKRERNSTRQIIQLLLNARASPDAVDPCGKTLLMCALDLGDEVILEQLITAGADVKMITAEGLSSLHYAITRNNIDICRKTIPLLIKASAPINVGDKRKNQTPLHYAVTARFAGVVEQLIRAGADVNAVGDNSMTCLDLVFDKDKLYGQYYEIVELLIKAGAKIDTRGVGSFEWQTPLIRAVTFGNPKLVKSLIAAGADAKVSSGGLTTIHHAVRSINVVETPEIITMLKRAGASLESRDLEGQTPLMFAIAQHNVKLIEQLIDLGADVNAIDSEARTILYKVCTVRSSFDLLKSLHRTIDLLVLAGAELRSSVGEYLSNPPIPEGTNYAYTRYLECREELKLMRSSYIYGSITYYQVLKRMKTHEYARNVHVIQRLKEKKFAGSFPIYGKDLEESFTAVLIRQTLVKPASHGLKRILKFNHNLIHERILENLDDDDLRNLYHT